MYQTQFAIYQSLTTARQLLDTMQRDVLLHPQHFSAVAKLVAEIHKALWDSYKELDIEQRKELHKLITLAETKN